ncbi:hypothetical protein C8R44DRAFT_387587 [Mycena epipterygia]|nr:hypothetical protein C8R44DRAFT_387587 [Mycena epipterygia]
MVSSSIGFCNAENHPVQLTDQSVSWIRPSTGQLCVEITSNFADFTLYYGVHFISESPHLRIPLSSLGPDPEMSIISCLTLDEFQELCYWYMSTTGYMSTLDKMHLGAIVSPHGESILEIAYIPNLTIRESGWKVTYDDQNVPSAMENGWSRLHSSCVHGAIQRTIYLNTDWDCWLAQANNVFSQIPTPPKYEDCLLINWIRYDLSCSGPSENLPEGYLFLCPLEDLRDDTGRWLPSPECPAYWSLNSSGKQMLNAEEASSLGFPPLEFEMVIWWLSYNEGVYAALSRFHAGKGFDPNSLDIARHLGHPIYQLSCSPNIDTGHIKEVSSDACEDPVLKSHEIQHRYKFTLELSD